MNGLSSLQLLFVVAAFVFQAVLIVHFALRKWRFAAAMRYGPLVYALGLPAAAVSAVLLAGGAAWTFWLAGFLYLVWAIFGYLVEYIRKIEWRSPPRWPILVPYLCLYLGAVLFYWFPLALVWKPFWYGYGLLFIASTLLNLTSHRGERAAR